MRVNTCLKSLWTIQLSVLPYATGVEYDGGSAEQPRQLMSRLLGGWHHQSYRMPPGSNMMEDLQDRHVNSCPDLWWKLPLSKLTICGWIVSRRSCILRCSCYQRCGKAERQDSMGTHRLDYFAKQTGVGMRKLADRDKKQKASVVARRVL